MARRDSRFLVWRRLRLADFALAASAFVATFGAGWAAEPALAAEPAKLTLDRVLESVDRHYPEILAADAQKTAQEFLVTRARGAFDPTLSAKANRGVEGPYQNTQLGAGLSGQAPGTPLRYGVEWDRLEGKNPSYYGERDTGSDGRAKAYLELPLLRDRDLDSARAGVEMALRKHAENLEHARLARLNAYRLAAIAHWTWIAAVEKQRAYEGLLSIALGRDDAVSKRVKRGQSPRIDGVDNQRMIMQRRSSLAKARLAAQSYALALSLFYRDEQGAPIVPDAAAAPGLGWASGAGSGPGFGSSSQGGAADVASLRAKLAEHPALRAGQEQIRQKEIERRLARVKLLPRLDLSLEKAEYYGALPPPRTEGSDLRIGLAFKFPLFNREGRGEAQARLLEVEAADQKQRLVRQKLEIDFQKLALQREAADEVRQLTAKEADLARQVEEAERVRFQHGDVDLLSVNLREQDAALARIRAIDAFVDFQEAEIELRLLANAWERTY